MPSREFGFSFQGRPVFEYIDRDAPHPSESDLEKEWFVFLMGPYTPFDATRAFPNGEGLESPYIEDPLFDPDRHVDEDGNPSYKVALEELAEDLREELGARVFIATDIDIPTEAEAAGGPGMSVLDQSIAFAAVSDAVMFVFTRGGLTTGTASEVGAILGEFHLREDSDEPVKKPRERFRIFRSPEFGSASIDEIPSTYGVDGIEFEDKADLIAKARQFLVNLEREDPDRVLPIFNPYKD